MSKKISLSYEYLVAGIVITALVTAFACAAYNCIQYKRIDALVRKHATAWETGSMDLLLETVHDDIIFAYPGRRLNKEELIEDFEGFADAFTDTKIYISNIVARGDMVGVEWQFATTNNDGVRTAVSDAIIGKVRDGKIISWKEYLDGRVSRMQIAGELPLEEGEEPFPWPVPLN